MLPTHHARSACSTRDNETIVAHDNWFDVELRLRYARNRERTPVREGFLAWRG